VLDRHLRLWIDPPLERAADRLRRTGVTANGVTVGGFVVGLAAMAAVAGEYYLIALVAVLVNRAADGLDGAVARRGGITDLGGYLDITLDFIFYSGVVFAFAVADPAARALAAAFLIFSFVGTGCSFLAFAVMAAKRGIATEARGRKSLYYLGGITEGSETIALFVLFCLLPQHFAILAWAFGALCWVTTGARIATAVLVLRRDEG